MHYVCIHTHTHDNNLYRIFLFVTPLRWLLFARLIADKAAVLQPLLHPTPHYVIHKTNKQIQLFNLSFPSWLSKTYTHSVQEFRSSKQTGQQVLMFFLYFHPLTSKRNLVILHHKWFRRKQCYWCSHQNNAFDCVCWEPLIFRGNLTQFEIYIPNTRFPFQKIKVLQSTSLDHLEDRTHLKCDPH